MVVVTVADLIAKADVVASSNKDPAELGVGEVMSTTTVASKAEDMVIDYTVLAVEAACDKLVGKIVLCVCAVQNAFSSCSVNSDLLMRVSVC